MNKLIAVLIIVLFLGVAIAPSIIADKQENNDYVTLQQNFVDGVQKILKVLAYSRNSKN